MTCSSRWRKDINEEADDFQLAGDNDFSYFASPLHKVIIDALDPNQFGKRVESSTLSSQGLCSTVLGYDGMEMEGAVMASLFANLETRLLENNIVYN